MRHQALRLEDSVNQICPWSGDPVSAEALTTYRGHVVGFCNSGCRDRFAAAVGAFDAVIEAMEEAGAPAALRLVEVQ